MTKPGEHPLPFTQLTHLPEDHLLKAIIDSTGDVIYVKDRQGRMIFANAATLELIGKPLNEVIGRTDVEFLADTTAAQLVMANDARIMNSGVGETVEEMVPYPDGTRRVWLSRKFPHRDANGGVIGLLGISHDVTEKYEAVEQLRSREAMLDAFFETSPGILNIKDDQFRYIKSDASTAAYFGLDRHSIVGKSLADLTPTYFNNAEPVMQQVLETGQPVLNVELSGPIPARPGEVGIWRASYFPVPLPDGKRGIGFIGIEITDLKRAETVMRESQAKLQAALSSMTDAVFISDASGHFLDMNDAFATFHRFKNRSECLDNLDDYPDILEVYWPDGKPVPLHDWAVPRALRGETVSNAEYGLRRKDTGEAWIGSYSFAPIKDALGNIVGSVVVARDVSEQKRAEQALRRSEEHFRTLADNISQLAWMADAEGAIFWYNQRWHDYTGTSLEQMKGDGWRRCHHPDHITRVVEKFYRCIEHGEPWEDTFPLRGIDGSYRWFLSRAVPIRDPQGRVLQWFGTNTDITAERDAKEAAEAASRAKDRLLAVVSHELRTPLNPILAITSMLQNNPDLSTELREDVATIRRNVEQEARIVDDLLSVTRLANEKIVLHQQAVDVHELVRTVLKELQPQMDAKHIGLLLQLRAKPQFIWADPGRIQQVLSNLLHNAVKFTPSDGQITVRSSNPFEGRLRLAVIDTGVGIDPDVLPRLFVPFEQGEQSITRKFGGLGLGLVIVKGIMDLHGASVHADSDGPGTGATFTLEFNTMAAPVETPKPAVPATPASSCRRVLLVEDHIDTMRVMARLLKNLGHDVITAGTMSEAIKRIDTEPFDLLISDIGLPDGSGLDVMRELKRRGHVPGIAISGYGHDEDLRRSQEAGFAEHLVKPVNADDLAASIHRAAC